MDGECVEPVRGWLVFERFVVGTIGEMMVATVGCVVTVAVDGHRFEVQRWRHVGRKG